MQGPVDDPQGAHRGRDLLELRRADEPISGFGFGEMGSSTEEFFGIYRGVDGVVENDVFCYGNWLVLGDIVVCMEPFGENFSFLMDGYMDEHVQRDDDTD